MRNKDLKVVGEGVAKRNMRRGGWCQDILNIEDEGSRMGRGDKGNDRFGSQTFPRMLFFCQTSPYVS